MARLIKTIWKFRIPLQDEVTIKMPAGAKILHVAAQRDIPYLWSLVDPSAPPEARHFRVACTGHPIQNADVLEHLGSFLMADDNLVFHLFEYPNNSPDFGS